MTSSEWAIKAPGLFIPQPFAAGDATHQKQFKDILNSIDGSDVNFIEGFTQAFEAPSSLGGRYVSRKELNAIGHLASANWFKRLCGGIFTFDANLAVKIGGYPKGAVLEYLNGLNYYRVISMVDNNMVDFTGKEPTVQQVGVVAGSVDGVNWAYCERGIVTEAGEHITELPIWFPTSLNFASVAETQACGQYRFDKTGYLSIYGSANVTGTGSSGQSGAPLGGFGVIIKASPFDGGPWETKYDMCYTAGKFDTAIIGSISYSSTELASIAVEPGTVYDIQIVGCTCTATLDLKARLV